MKTTLNVCSRRFALIGVVLQIGLFSGPARAEDYFNTFLWNRDNFEKKNGEIDRGDWYEWWYYKVLVPGSDESFYLTYGVVNPWDQAAEKKASRAFVSFGSFGAHEIVEQVLPVTALQVSYEKPWVQIGNQIASATEARGEITTPDGKKAQWDLSIEKDWRYNAMSWAMGVDGISNIYWYPAQASAWMSGWIRYNGREFRLDRAPGYQDRNWGRSFPKWWTWLVSNQFKDSPGTVLAAGGGRPLVLNHWDVDGLSVGLRHEGKTYQFRTNEGSSVQMDIRFGKWEVTATNAKGQKIVIQANSPREKFLILPFQTPQGPMFYDYEALRGHLELTLYERSGFLGRAWKQIAHLTTEDAGIEFGSGDLQEVRGFFDRSFQF